MRSEAPGRFADPRLLVEKPLPQDGQVRRTGKGKKKSRKRLARSLTVNLAESPLGWLHAHGHLSDRQFDAGERLRSDWERANLAPNITMNWQMTPGSGGRRHAPTMLHQSEMQIAAKQRFDRGLAYIGEDLCDIAWRIICGGEAVPVAEKALGWPARSGKLVLRIALDRLGDYYRLPSA